MFSAVESFLFISSSGLSCFYHRVCSRTRKPQRVLISNFFEVLRLYLILSTFLSIPCAQGTTLIKQCSKVLTKTYHWSFKIVLIFLRSNCYLDIKLVAFLSFLVMVTVKNERFFIYKAFYWFPAFPGFRFLP